MRQIYLLFFLPVFIFAGIMAICLTASGPGGQQNYPIQIGLSIFFFLLGLMLHSLNSFLILDLFTKENKKKYLKYSSRNFWKTKVNNLLILSDSTKVSLEREVEIGPKGTRMEWYFLVFSDSLNDDVIRTVGFGSMEKADKLKMRILEFLNEDSPSDINFSQREMNMGAAMSFIVALIALILWFFGFP